MKMYIENKDQMIALLKLAGYVELSVLSTPGPYRDLAPPVYVHKDLPAVSVAWINGCEIQNYAPSFFSFNEAWAYIQGFNHDGH